MAFMRHLRAPTVKKERPKFVFADRSADLTQYEERHQRNGRNDSKRHQSSQSIGADLCDALGHWLAIPHPDNHMLHNMETNERDAEQKRFEQDRINERFIIQPVAQMQVFGHEHDFCEDQGINDSKTMRHIIYLML